MAQLAAAAVSLCLAGVSAHGQTLCPGVNFRTESSVNLAPGATSHIRLARQSDGSYTGYEISDAAPYAIVSVTPNFRDRVTPCTLTNSTYQVEQPDAIARLASGEYLYVTNYPVGPGQPGRLRAVLFDPAFHFLSQSDYAANGISVLADLNGDGALDIVAATQFGKNAGITILTGSGGTIFQPPVVYGTSAFLQISAIAIGDLDGDGKPDVVVAAIGSTNPGSHIFVLYGNGDGTLQPPVPLATGWGRQAVAIGDVNRDGIPDLVFTVGSQNDNSAPPYVAVALGRGARAFADPVTYPTGGSGAVAIGDVDGDGNPDIVTNGVTVYFGDGKGGFPRRRDWFNDAQGSVMLTDFDRDGETDIVIGSGTSEVLAGNRVAVLFNRGGDFSGAPVTPVYTLNYGILQMQTADLNRDGIPDVVLTDLSQIFALLGKRDGSFTQVYALSPSAGEFPGGRFALGDFNGDGIPDLVTGLGNASGIHLAVFLGRGNGSFQQFSLIPVPNPIEGLATADFNGDGKLDLAVLSNAPVSGTNDAVTIYFGDGKGGLGAPVGYGVGPIAMAMTVADFNGDGWPDIGVAARGAYQASNSEITLLESSGSGFARSAIPMGEEGPYALTAADLNGDGVLDLAVQCTSGRSATFLGRAGGTFGAPSFLAEKAQPGISSVVGFAVADLNGDGHPDLIGWGENAGIFLGNGDGTFQPQFPLPQMFAPFAVADLGGNRLPDVLMGDGVTGVAAFLNESLPRPPRRRSHAEPRP